jgi:hypothetical protein
MSFKDVGTLLWVNSQHTDESIKLAVKETLENSSVIVAQIPWSPSDCTFIQNTSWYYQLAIDHGKLFMLNIDWLENNRSGTRGGWSFENENIRQQFKRDIRKLVEVYNPHFLTLGVEVNYYALTSPEGYRNFIKIFNDLKLELKESNPSTQIGLSFQLELLFGIHSDWERTKTLKTLDVVVENLDYLGISTYPDLVDQEVMEPFGSLNYIDSLVKCDYKKPVGITETALPSSTYSESQREDYIRSVYGKFHSLNLSFLVWGSIIDDPKKELREHEIGLLESDGTPKKEFKIWKDENLKIIK